MKKRAVSGLELLIKIYDILKLLCYLTGVLASICGEHKSRDWVEKIEGPDETEAHK